MTAPPRTPFLMSASFTVLLGLAALLWAATVANCITIKSSDAAGNALSQAFGVFMAIGLWVLLAIVVTLAAIRGGMPGWMRVAAFVLVPASGVATIAAIEALSQATEWPVKWPLAIPILAPAMIIALSLWSYMPSLRAHASPQVLGGLVFGALAVMSVAPWPLLRERGQLRRAGPGTLQAVRAAKRARWSERDRAAERAEFAAIEPDAPLYSWLEYTEPGDPMRDRAIAAILRLPDRQREVEEMVRSGNVAAIREVPTIAAQATPALCDAVRESITFHARRVRPDDGSQAPYAKYARDVEYYMPTVEWLVARGCRLDAALAELEATASAYGDAPERARFIARLAQLRQPSMKR